MRNLLTIIGLMVAAGIAGYLLHQPGLPAPVVIQQTTNLDSVYAEWLKTHVEIERFVDVQERLKQALRSNILLGSEKTLILAAVKARLDSMAALGQKPDIRNFVTNDTSTIAAVTLVDTGDSLTSDTTHATAVTHAEFYSDPVNLFHDVKTKISPLFRKVTVQPVFREVDAPRGFTFGGDFMFLGGLGGGIHVGYDNIRFGVGAQEGKGIYGQFSFDK